MTLWRCLICGAHVSDRAAHLAGHDEDVFGPADPRHRADCALLRPDGETHYPCNCQPPHSGPSGETR